MKGCELCDRVARMYCESDQASLCWECDAKVHGANFLVARHPRVLLCRTCQAPTPWRAAGARLSPTFSVCERCAARGKASPVEEWEEEAEGGGEMMEEDEEDDYDDDGSDSDEEEDLEEEEGENQVVPWSLTPPPPESSSSGEESSSTGRASAVLVSQMGGNADLAFQHDLTCSSSRRNHLAAELELPPPPPTLASSFSDRSTDSVSSSSTSNDRRRRSLLRQANQQSIATAGACNHISTYGDRTTFDLVSSASRSPPI